MSRVPTPMADLSVRDRELLRLATLDPDTTATLSRYVHVETAIGLVAGVAFGLAGAILVLVQNASAWWGLLSAGVAAALSGGVWVRSRRWVATVTVPLISPAHSSTCLARFGREPHPRYPSLPGPDYAYLHYSTSGRRCERVPLIGGQRPPDSEQRPVTITVITGCRHRWRPTVLIVDDTVLFASPVSLTSRMQALIWRIGPDL